MRQNIFTNANKTDHDKWIMWSLNICVTVLVLFIMFSVLWILPVKRAEKHWISVLLENFVSIESSWTLFYLILFKCSFMEIGQWETAFVSLSAFSCTSFILCVRMITQSSYDKFKAFSQACCFIYSQEGVQKPAKRVLPSPSPHTQPNKSPRPGEFCTGKC